MAHHDHQSHAASAGRGRIREIGLLLAGGGLAAAVGCIVFGIAHGMSRQGPVGQPLAGVFDVMPSPQVVAPEPDEDASQTPTATVRPVVPAGPSREELLARQQEVQSPQWQQVQQALENQDATHAAMQLARYREEHSASVLKQDTARMLDEQMDRIWWQRIASLMNSREVLLLQQAEVASKYRQEFRSEVKANIQKQLDAIAGQIDRINRELYDMHYSFTIAPNLKDPGMLSELRRSRDRDAYAIWKNRVLPRLMRSGGQYPVDWQDPAAADPPATDPSSATPQPAPR